MVTINVVMVLLGVTLTIGFGLGYGLRSYISSYRRRLHYR
jgi:hypothetical protein